MVTHDEDGDRRAALGSRDDAARRSAGRGSGLTLVAQVVPDIPSFGVDDGFAYSVPATLDVRVGTIVRVPLGGRRVRGWVVDIREARHGRPAKTLKEIVAVSASIPVFGPRLLEALRWSALHYVAPLAAVLPRAGPPNLPRGRSTAGHLREAATVRSHLAHVAGPGPWADTISTLAQAHVANGSNVLVLAPTVLEVAGLAKSISVPGAATLTATSDEQAADVTATWVAMQQPDPCVLVATREAMLWPLGRLGLAIVVEPGRRAYKSPQSPTMNARDVLRRRSSIERFGLTTVGAVPPLELVAAGARLSYPGARAWPLVEVMDRSQEPPGRGIAMDATRRAIVSSTNRGERVFVFVTRRGYAPAFRCVRCRTLRRCEVCGGGPDRGDTCRRCGAALGVCVECGAGRFEPLGAGVDRVVEDLKRSIGDEVGDATAGRRVTVGTERDLPAAQSVDLAVVMDADALLLAPHYRAEEEALRLLTRVAGTVQRGRGHRAVIQTAQPDHRVIRAVRSGSAEAVVAEMLAEREASGLPPVGQLMAVEVAGDAPSVDAELREAADGDAEVFGPADAGERSRWLVQGGSLHRAKVRMRPAVQRWRDQGYRVRVDADPIDL